MSWLRDLLQKSDAGGTIRVTKIGASRALFTGPDIKERVEVRLEIEDGHTLVLDLNIDQCFHLITGLSAVYTAVNPPLRPDLRGTGANNTF